MKFLYWNFPNSSLRKKNKTLHSSKSKRRMKHFASLALILCLAVLVHGAAKYTAVFEHATKEWRIEKGTHGVAWAELHDTVNTTGWYVLKVISNEAQSDEMQAYGAGFVEVKPIY
jgi:hypothetical protein